MKIEYTLTLEEGLYPNGSMASFQRQPLRTWLITPKKVDHANQYKSISLNGPQS